MGRINKKAVCSGSISQLVTTEVEMQRSVTRTSSVGATPLHARTVGETPSRVGSLRKDDGVNAGGDRQILHGGHNAVLLGGLGVEGGGFTKELLDSSRA